MCTLCEEQLSCKGGSTSGLKRHLEMRHPPNPKSRAASSTSTKTTSSSPSGKTITGFFNLSKPVMSRQQVEIYRNKLARMAVADMLPLNFSTKEGFHDVAQFLYPGMFHHSIFKMDCVRGP